MKHPLLTQKWNILDQPTCIEIYNDGFLVHSEEKPAGTLDEVIRKFVKELKPLPFAKLREEKLCEGLILLAKKAGTKIENPHSIDSNGEIKIHGKENNQREHTPFGEELVKILNRYPVRRGTQATIGHVLPENNWGKMHHFDVQKMLKTELPEFEFAKTPTS